MTPPEATGGQLAFDGWGDWPEAPRRPPVTPPALDAEQLAFDLALPVALGPDDFFVSESNADAHAMLAQGLRWPDNRLVLVGPQGAGKTHLARIWAGQAGAELRAARDLDARLPPEGAAVAVEDMEGLPRAAEGAMLHLHNHLLSTGGRLLMTADRPPSRWGIALPDLASRVQAAALARLLPPDDALVEALLAKHFSDRQLFPAPGVLAFLARRIERSHAAVARAVAGLDRLALSEGREVGLALARRWAEAAEAAGAAGLAGGAPDGEDGAAP